MTAKTWTPLPLVKTTAAFFADKGIDSARLDAELLLCHVLGLANRIELYTGFERPLTSAEVDAYRAFVRRRAAREPVSHILGYRDFMGIRFRVTPAVLAPRPETEILVEEAVRWIEGRTAGPPDLAVEESGSEAPAEEEAAGPGGEAVDPGAARGSAPARVLDLGTGSGCIGVSVAALCPGATVVATDIDPETLAVARTNAEDAGVADRVELREGDLFAACMPGDTFDLILCNPPYVAEGDPEVWPEVRDYEPAVAVFSGADGFEFHQRVAAEAETWLNPGGALLLEVGAGQAEDVQALVDRAQGLVPERTLADHAGVARVVVARTAVEQGER